MTYFPDLSPYTYMKSSGMAPGITPLNIGWLARGKPYSIDTSGWPDQIFLDALAFFEQGGYHVNDTRGWHVCELCAESVEEMLEDWQKSCQEGKLCDSELRVLGEDGVAYAAPAMLYYCASVSTA